MLSEFSNSFLSLLPPLSAILLAVFTRRVLFSIGFGAVLGALMLHQFDVFAAGHYLSGVALANFNFENMSIILFLILMGIMMQLMLSLGASTAFARWVFKHMKTRRSAKWVINVMALVFFIDDYLHSLLAGNISRPIADQYRISRAKLAYLLDSTAATLCVAIPISSWGGYIIGLIAAILTMHQIQDTSAFSVFMQTTPMMFYVWFTLLIVACVSHFNINVGPMAKHEEQALTTSNTSVTAAKEHANNNEVSLWWVLAPIAITTCTTLVSMLWTGAHSLTEQGKPFGIFAAFEQTQVGLSICVGGLAGVLLLTGVCFQRMTLKMFCQQSYMGVQAMLPAIIILLFAWSIGTVVNAIGTGQYLSNVVQAYISPVWLPCLLFVFAGFMALATGTSLGTFGIMLPLAADIAVATDIALLLPVMAAVLCGAVFGDHCSPISDTTILSASGAGCDHMDHVVTQAPYALFGAFVSAISFVVLGFTQSTGLSFLIGLGVLAATVCVLVVRAEKKIPCHSA